MRQLKPRTILAIGLPLSLLLNLLASYLLGSLYLQTFVPNMVPLIVAVVAWLTLNVPILSAMAVIRNRIGQFESHRQRIKAAVLCCLACFAMAIIAFLCAAGVWFALVALNNNVLELWFLPTLFFLSGTISVVLAILTLLNTIVRIIQHRRNTRPGLVG